MLKTERLILRRWEDSDAEDLFKYASDPDVDIPLMHEKRTGHVRLIIKEDWITHTIPGV